MFSSFSIICKVEFKQTQVLLQLYQSSQFYKQFYQQSYQQLYQSLASAALSAQKMSHQSNIISQSNQFVVIDLCVRIQSISFSQFIFNLADESVINLNAESVINIVAEFF